jgi:hypothetical protein
MENTTQPQGVAIEPVVYPLNEGTATILTVLVEAFMTDATTASTYYRLLTQEGKILMDGRYQMTEEQFAEWGRDNNVVNEYVANAIGVTIINN